VDDVVVEPMEEDPSGDMEDSDSSPTVEKRQSSHQRHLSQRAFPKFKRGSPTDALKRNKYSSTSTLFVANTISKPDVDELLMCMARAILFHVQRGASSVQKTYYEYFDETRHPVFKEPVDFKRLPSEADVYLFIKKVYTYGKMDPECIIMGLAYVERMQETCKITMDTTNWRRILLSSLIVALKAWEDLAVWNDEMVGMFEGTITVKDLNVIEIQFLCLIHFNVFIPASLYAKYYFDLRTLSKKDQEQFPLQPLSKENEQLLEARSTKVQNHARELKKSLSVDQLRPVHVTLPVAIN